MDGRSLYEVITPGPYCARERRSRICSQKTRYGYPPRTAKWQAGIGTSIRAPARTGTIRHFGVPKRRSLDNCVFHHRYVLRIQAPYGAPSPEVPAEKHPFNDPGLLWVSISPTASPENAKAQKTKEPRWLFCFEMPHSYGRGRIPASWCALRYSEGFRYPRGARGAKNPRSSRMATLRRLAARY